MTAKNEFHQECFKPGDAVLCDATNSILYVDEQINQWVFAHDINGRKYEYDCVNRDMWRAFVGDF